MEDNYKNLEQRSLVAFIVVAFFILLCAILVNFSLNLQQSMLKASGVSYEQRVLLEQVSKKIRFLVENATDSNVVPRVLLKTREDIASLAHRINYNQFVLEKLLLDQAQLRYRFGFLFESEETAPHLVQVDGHLQVFNQYVFELMKISLRELGSRYGYGYLDPSQSMTDDSGAFLSTMSSVNGAIFQASLYQNRLLYFLYALLLFLVLIGIWLVWLFMLRPLLRQRETHYQEMAGKNQTLAFHALHDDLTRLPRRVAFNKKMAELEEGGLILNQAALMLIDVDHFKSINDNFGHQAGDEVLVWMAKCLTSQLDSHAHAYRLGGDEFALIIEKKPDKTYLKAIAEQQTEWLREPYYFRDVKLTLSCSIGIAVGEKSGSRMEEIFSAADIALYHAKRNGRNQYCFFSDISQIDIGQHLWMEKELLIAIERKEFIAQYQPIVDLSDQRLQSFEVLARWRHPEKGILAPKQWLSLAEKLSVASVITGQIIEQVIQDRASWLKAGHKACPLQVNVTESMLVDGSLNRLLTAFDEGGEDVNWLVIEVTESIVFERAFETVKNHLQALSELGVKIALDDFGTGFANLAHLRRVPFDSIKLDKSFVTTLQNDAGMRVIVSSMVNMVKGLGKQIVCEGVENEGTRHILIGMGCKLAQGYLFSKPMTFSEATNWLPENCAPEN